MNARPRVQWPVVVAVVLASVCFVVSCGGDDDDDEGSGEVGAPAATADDLEAQPWQLRSYAVEGADDLSAASESEPATATFTGGNASGSTGCNQYDVSYDLGSDGAIEFGDAAVTRALCAGDVDAQEQALLQGLGNARRAVLEDDALQFLDAQGNPLLFFEPAPSG